MRREFKCSNLFKKPQKFGYKKKSNESEFGQRGG